jgi:hypothetical protein
MRRVNLMEKIELGAIRYNEKRTLLVSTKALKEQIAQ